jgi:hypothetical protein
MKRGDEQQSGQAMMRSEHLLLCVWFPCVSFYLMMVHCIWASWRAYEFTSPTTCEPASLRAFRASEKSSTLRAPGLGEDWGGWMDAEGRGGLDSLLSKGYLGGMEWNG